MILLVAGLGAFGAVTPRAFDGLFPEGDEFRIPEPTPVQITHILQDELTREPRPHDVESDPVAPVVEPVPPPWAGPQNFLYLTPLRDPAAGLEKVTDACQFAFQFRDAGLGAFGAELVLCSLNE